MCLAFDDVAVRGLVRKEPGAPRTSRRGRGSRETGWRARVIGGIHVLSQLKLGTGKQELAAIEVNVEGATRWAEHKSARWEIIDMDRRVQAQLSAAALVASGVVLQGAPANGLPNWEASNYAVVALAGNDQFTNYDHNTTNLGNDGGWNNVDWPVTMFFYNNAHVQQIKSAMLARGQPWNQNAGTMHLLQKDDAYLAWDNDNGVKSNGTGCETAAYHLRVYARYPQDRNWNPVDGYYVLGTTHKDFHDGCSSLLREFGWSELAENAFAGFMGEHGRPYQDDAIVFSNFEANGDEFAEGERHYWMNDGNATAVNWNL